MSIKQLTPDQREALAGIVDDLAAEDDGRVSRLKCAERVEGFLEDQLAAGLLPGLLPSIAQTLVDRALKNRAWKADGQIALFSGDALLALGDGHYVRMSDATAEDLLRHDRVLSENFSSTSQQYFAKKTYLNKNIPRLLQAGGRLGDLEL